MGVDPNRMHAGVFATSIQVKRSGYLISLLPLPHGRGESSVTWNPAITIKTMALWMTHN